MTSGRDQVVYLTAGSQLPSPPLTDIQLGVLAKAIEDAWKRLVASGLSSRNDDPEALLNAGLVVELQMALEADGESLFKSLVSVVARGAEQHNFDGRELEKRPDLSFYLTDRHRGIPFCGECKIIDARTRKGLRTYSKDGIERFVSGKYNWFFSQGFMVAYVRDATQAGPALESVTGRPAIPWLWRGTLRYRTAHMRTFEYPDRDPAEVPPGSVTLTHLWLDGVPKGMHRPRRRRPQPSGQLSPETGEHRPKSRTARVT